MQSATSAATTSKTRSSSRTRRSYWARLRVRSRGNTTAHPLFVFSMLLVAVANNWACCGSPSKAQRWHPSSSLRFTDAERPLRRKLEVRYYRRRRPLDTPVRHNSLLTTPLIRSQDRNAGGSELVRARRKCHPAGQINDAVGFHPTLLGYVPRQASLRCIRGSRMPTAKRRCQWP